VGPLPQYYELKGPRATRNHTYKSKTRGFKEFTLASVFLCACVAAGLNSESEKGKKSGKWGEMGPGLEALLASVAKRDLIENREAAVGVQAQLGNVLQL
jgi:hypothetical protein